jgi:hypothetical protein
LLAVYPVTVNNQADMNIPPLVVTKRLVNGTPVRAVCPLCDTAFSTEAFDGDSSFPHEAKLSEWYSEHFVVHLEQ